MASAVLAVGGPFWGENGHLCQGIDNDPRKLRGMLKRLDLPGWENAVGVEANPGRWDAIRGAVNKDHVRGNGDGFKTQWTADIKDGGPSVVMWTGGASRPVSSCGSHHRGRRSARARRACSLPTTRRRSGLQRRRRGRQQRPQSVDCPVV